MRNTKKRGVYQFFVYPEKKDHYVGVCLTLNIVEEGDDPKKLMDSIVEAAEGHILTVIKENLSNDLLNRPAPKKYWDKYKKFQEYVQLKGSAQEQTPAFISGARSQETIKPSKDLVNA